MHYTVTQTKDATVFSATPLSRLLSHLNTLFQTSAVSGLGTRLHLDCGGCRLERLVHVRDVKHEGKFYSQFEVQLKALDQNVGNVTATLTLVVSSLQIYDFYDEESKC